MKNRIVTFFDSDDDGKGIDSSRIKNNDYNYKLSDSELSLIMKINKEKNIGNINEFINNAVSENSLDVLFQELDRYASHYFNTSARLCLKYKDDTIIISQYNDVVYMSTIMASAFWSFIAVQLYQSYLIDNNESGSNEDLFCYRYTLFVLNNMCFNDFKQPVNYPDEQSHDLLLTKFKDKINLLNITSDIYYSSIAFAFLHEISHAYLYHDGEQINIEKEIEADTLAYKILLDFICDINEDKIQSAFTESLKPYTIMAPMYLLDFYYVIYYTGSFLCPYHTVVKKNEFDQIVERKNKLLNIIYESDRDFNEEEAYDIYNCYVDGEESFLESFVSSDKSGLLNELKRRNSERYHD